MRNQQRKTLHSQVRQQQRGIDDLMVKLVQEFGVSAYQCGGCEIEYIQHKMIRQLREAIDRLAGVTLVKGSDNKLVTAMHQTKKIRATSLIA